MSARRVIPTLALATASIAAVSLGLMVGVAPAGASPPSTYVAPTGSDTATCGSASAPCHTISWALTRTPSGGTIRVAAGTYAEQLVISQNVTIVGAGSAKTVIEPSSLPNADTDTDSTTPQYAIVDVTPGWSASLQSLTVNGAAASNQFTGCADNFIGAYFHDARGSLSGVDVTNIELPTALFGCQDGTGVYVATDPGSATPSNVTMSDVSVNNYDKNGITCDDLETVCSILSSAVTGIGPTPLIAQNGIQVWAASATIVGDIVTGNSYTDPEFSSLSGYYTTGSGVLVINAADLNVSWNLIGGNDDNLDAIWDPTISTPPPGVPTPGSWSISDNDASGAVNNSGPTAINNAYTAANSLPAAIAVPFGYGVGEGIDLISTASSASVVSNVVNDDPEFGIALYGVSDASVDSNSATGDGYGLYVGGPGYGTSTSSHNWVGSNTAKDNLQVGIYVDTETSANNLDRNIATGNPTEDVVDASTGSGTEGTANTWLSTTCNTSSPAGLCTSAPHQPPPHRPPHPKGPPPFHGWW